jgi:Fe-S-cluster-containing hydrogenase component 2
VEALHVDPKTNARVINNDTCIACGKCETSCIFPSLDEALATGGQHLNQKSRISYDPKMDVYTKCDLCNFRPEGPACIERCPVNIKIVQKQISSDVMCLDLSPKVNQETFNARRPKQTASANRRDMPS